MLDLEINLSELVRALSQALDLAEYNTFVHHGQRVAYIAVRVGQTLGLNETGLRALYYGGLLHDIGVTGAGGVRRLEDELFLKSHGTIGALLVAKLPLPEVPLLVKHHHESYDGSGVNGLRGDNIPIGARLLNLADAVDACVAGQELSLVLKESVAAMVQGGRGSSFDPDACDAFLSTIKQDRFWFDLQGRNLYSALQMLQMDSTSKVDCDELESIALVFADIIDSKSRFTRTHSVGLAVLVRKVAQANSLSERTDKLLFSAGLLHDLGKLAVPNEILEKPSGLTPEEYYIVKSHVYYTKAILSQVRGLSELANWAGNHHERLDGRGYADRLPASALGVEDRLMAICDVYQALTEERPYRQGESPRKALEIIESMVKGGGLCPKATGMVANTVL
ncbi:MAG: metal dependent phosphohydrolase [Bacillota bacterium]|nr:MAG: metal dependent phosphohydrolase [Bacillota bacterium]